MNNHSNAVINGKELKEIREENQHVYIQSDFKFLMAHKGLRPGCLHLLLGTSGSGKSTVVRKIIVETAKQYPVLLWLSEEDREDFLVAISKNYPGQDIAENIIIISEQDQCDSVTPAQLWDIFLEALRTHKPKSVFFDNITTSAMYEGLRPSEQGKVARALKNVCRKMQCPFVLVAHTRADVTDSSGKLIDDNDIRGGKALGNLVPYFYIFQRFEIDSHFFPTIRIRKSRKHQIDSRLFLLDYSRNLNSYTGDREITFKEFKEAYSRRNTL